MHEGYDGNDDGILAVINPSRSWQKWFAWRPIVLDGNRIWLKNVYRRKFYAGGIHYGYEYGTIFDVLMDNESWQ